MSKTWAIIGGGNGGQAIAGHLASMGEAVRLYDVMQSTVDELNEKGRIKIHHAVEGEGKLQFATTDMEKAICGADVLMVVLPAIYHKSIARKMIPHLSDGQVILLHPEASCGALEFRAQMKEMGCSADVVVGAACTLLYSTRLQSNGEVYIFGLKSEVAMAALPATDNAKLEAAIHPQLPWFKLVGNVVEVSLDNLNAMMHPAPMLLNTSRIEAEPFVSFEYYHEGITPSIGKYICAMDKERIAIAEQFGYTQRNICDEYIAMYRCAEPGTPLYRICRQNPGYEGIMTSNTLATRYLLEDIPYSLEPIRALARVVGVATPCIDAMITLGRVILDDKMDAGRTAQALGIADMSKEQLLKYING